MRHEHPDIATGLRLGSIALVSAVLAAALVITAGQTLTQREIPASDGPTQTERPALIRAALD